MTIRNITNTATYTPASVKATSAQQGPKPLPAERMAAPPVIGTQVSISDAARQRQADEKGDPVPSSAVQEGATEKAEAFAYGVLGMDHPDEVKTESDDFYTAGQVLSAIGTVATVLLAIA